uniref:Uncharacterized protein n=1 Tax=Rhizophora mucronata TaxID=61149 RepID=A0A2P2IJM6_RHIMU
MNLFLDIFLHRCFYKVKIPLLILLMHHSENFCLKHDIDICSLHGKFNDLRICQKWTLVSIWIIRTSCSSRCRVAAAND